MGVVDTVEANASKTKQNSKTIRDCLSNRVISM